MLISFLVLKQVQKRRRKRRRRKRRKRKKIYFSGDAIVYTK